MPQTSYAADMWTTLQEWWSLPDWIAGGILLVGLLGGIRRGLSGELSRLLALVLSFSGAWHFHHLAVPLLQPRLDWGEDALRLTSFVSIFLLLYLVLKVIRFAVHTILNITFRGPLEYVGGALLGLLRYSLVVVMLFLIANQVPSERVRTHLADSRMHHLIQEQFQPAYDSLAETFPILKSSPAASDELYQDLAPQPWDALDAWIDDASREETSP